MLSNINNLVKADEFLELSPVSRRNFKIPTAIVMIY